MIPTDGYGDRAEEAAVKAEDAKQRAEKAANTIEDILTKLPGDQKKIDEIPESIATANREIRNAQNQGTFIKKFYRLIQIQYPTVDDNH